MNQEILLLLGIRPFHIHDTDQILIKFILMCQMVLIFKVCEMHHFGKLWQYLLMLNIHKHYELAIPLLGVYSTQMPHLFTKRHV